MTPPLRALLLAAGLGTRLRPITDKRPNVWSRWAVNRFLAGG